MGAKSKRKTKDEPAPPESDANPKVERLVYEAMQSLGWLFPMTPAQVGHVETELDAGDAILPECLREPGELFSGSLVRRSSRASTSEPSAADEQMACAAREGGEVPSDVRAKMDSDREKAERQPDENQ